MLFRTLVTVVVLSVPVDAQAAGYVVHRGDTLGAIALRSRVSISVLARVNGIRDPNRVRAGRVLFIPGPPRGYGSWSAPRSAYSRSLRALRSVPGTAATGVVPAYRSWYGWYRVRWGDTLSGLALRYHTSVARLRALNPSLGPYLLAGQRLNLCPSCGSGASMGTWQTVQSPSVVRRSVVLPAVRTVYTPVRIVPRYPVSPVSRPSYRIVTSPHAYPAWRPTIPAGYQARALITAYARQYGLESSLPLAIGAQESGFQQTAVSRAGAVGVMQVEPTTARQIGALLGRPVNLYSLDDNIHAGVFWLAHLVARYGGNERLAAAAYYQGSSSLARRGVYTDTVRYVSRAMVLKTKYGG